MPHDPSIANTTLLNQRGFIKGLFTIVILLATFSAGTIWFFLFTGSDAGEVTEVLIPRKTPLKSVAKLLHEKDIIRYPRAFKLLLRVTRGENKVRAGEFSFRRNMKLWSALQVVYYHEPIVHPITIPEGWTIRQIAQALAQSKLVEENKFLELALSRTYAQKYRLNAPHMEGFLFPETYTFSRVDGEERILDRMVQTFFERFTPELRQRAKDLGWSIEQITTLASIIEKETGAAQERPIISSVFHNRLKKRMRLQSDPTTIYGIENFNGNLTKNDLHRTHAYNTYTIPGLPPGPIASCGIEAIRAAIEPATTDYLYFVSNNNGTHVFTQDYKSHSAKVHETQIKPVSRKQKRTPKSTKR